MPKSRLGRVLVLITIEGVHILEKINSKDNAKIKEYAKLFSSKSYRDSTGLFCVEGYKLVKEAEKSGVKIETVFVTSDCLSRYGEELEKLFQETKTFLIAPELEKKLTEQKSPQGIYAVCKKRGGLSDISAVRSGKYVMLVNLQDTGNVGTIIRTAEALGLNGVVTTAKTCDVHSPKVVRGSMGSVFRMPVFIVPDEYEAVETFKKSGMTVYASVVDSSAKSLNDTEFSKNAVLLIGNEGNGLEQALSDKASEKITIKMSGNTESLNASMASCILMWEMSK